MQPVPGQTTPAFAPWSGLGCGGLVLVGCRWGIPPLRRCRRLLQLCGLVGRDADHQGSSVAGRSLNGWVVDRQAIGDAAIPEELDPLAGGFDEAVARFSPLGQGRLG